MQPCYRFCAGSPCYSSMEYNVASLVLRCQLGLAPTYLMDPCRSMSGIASGCSLRSVGALSALFAHTTIMKTRDFCVNGPSVWNGLPLGLCLISRTLSDTFYNCLKTVLFDSARVGSASE